MSPTLEPTLSVLMPVYNGAYHLGQTIDSILGQSFGDFEFIVADDGSTDATWDLLQEFAQRDHRIRLIRNEANLGIARSMNNLFRQARGRYINRHDADDLSLPDRFRQQVAFFESNPAVGAVATQVTIIDEAGQPIGLELYAGPLDNDGIQRQLMSHCTFCQTSVMFRRKLLEVVGLYDESLGSAAEDYDLWLRLAEVTQLARLPDRLCQYRYHGGSNSFNISGRVFQHVAIVIERMIARRFGTNAPRAWFQPVGDNYRMAAELYSRDGQIELAQENLIKSFLTYPEAFSRETTYFPVPAGVDSLAFAEQVLKAVPHSSRYRTPKARLKTRLRLKEIFSAEGPRREALVDTYLWAALVDDPEWGLNRGVLSLLARSLQRRLLRQTRRLDDPIQQD